MAFGNPLYNTNNRKNDSPNSPNRELNRVYQRPKKEIEIKDEDICKVFVLLLQDK
jgi:hypothetical protein